jgi:hypothetical protein
MPEFGAEKRIKSDLWKSMDEGNYTVVSTKEKERKK